MTICPHISSFVHHTVLLSIVLNPFRLDKLFLGKSNDDLMAIVNNIKKSDRGPKVNDEFISKACERLVSVLYESYDEFTSTGENEAVINKEFEKRKVKTEEPSSKTERDAIKKEGGMEVETLNLNENSDLLCPEEVKS